MLRLNTTVKKLFHGRLLKLKKKLCQSTKKACTQKKIQVFFRLILGNSTSFLCVCVCMLFYKKYLPDALNALNLNIEVFFVASAHCFKVTISITMAQKLLSGKSFLEIL